MGNRGIGNFLSNSLESGSYGEEYEPGLVGQDMSGPEMKMPSTNTSGGGASDIAQKGIAGASMGGPWGAAAMIGASMLEGYMNRKQKEREMLAASEQYRSEGQGKALGNLMQAWRSALS